MAESNMILNRDTITIVSSPFISKYDIKDTFIVSLNTGVKCEFKKIKDKVGYDCKSKDNSIIVMEVFDGDCLLASRWSKYRHLIKRV